MIKKSVSVLLAVLLVFGIVPFGALQAFAAEPEYQTLAPGETKTAVITEDSGAAKFIITPSADSPCAFYSTGESDTKASLYNSEHSLLLYNDDGGDSGNFRLVYMLEAGNTYYLEADFWGNATGSFEVTCETVPKANSIRFENSEMTAYMGVPDSLDLIIEPKGAYAGEITFSCTNENVAALTQYTDYVIVEYLSEGTATVTATTTTGLSAQCDLTVIYPETLTLGELRHDSIEKPGSYKAYCFVPETSGWYIFTSDANDRFNGNLYDDEKNYLCGETSYDGSFRMKKELEAGNTYYLSAGFLDSGITGDYTVQVEPGYTVTKLTIINEPDKTTYYEGFKDYEIDYDGLLIELQWSDGETTYWSSGYYDPALRGEYMYTTLNEDNTVTFSCDDQSDSFALTVVENPVSKIEITGEIPVLIEKNGGYWDQRYDYETDEYGEMYYRYNLYELYNTEVTIYYKNGSAEKAGIGEMVDGYRIDLIDDQDRTPFTLGDNNTVVVSYLGHTAEAKVTVAESPVASIEIVGGSQPVFVEETDGNWSKRLNPETGNYDLDYFRYNTYAIDSTEVLIRYKDGTSETAYVGQELNGYPVTATSDQEEQPWTVGGENLLTISYLGASTQISAVITPNPVASIELPEGAFAELYEYVDGYFSTDYTGEEVFIYYLPDLSDIPVTINYTNGASVTTHLDGMVDGKRVRYDDNQFEVPWTKGGDNYITVSYMGRTADLPVVITDSPVTSINVLSNPTYVYTYGDEYYGGAEYFYPRNLTGMSFEVHFKDGTTKTYTSEDMDAYASHVDGHVFEMAAANDTLTVGDNEYIFSYMGKTASFNVKVKENTVKSVQMTKLPEKTLWTQYYSPNWIGAQITVTYTDNTTKTVTIGRDNLTYSGVVGVSCNAEIEIDGMIAKISEFYEWDNGGEVPSRTYYRLNYAGKTTEITGINYKEEKSVVSVEIEDYSPTGENMLVTATFEDGTKESVRLSDIYAFKDTRLPEIKQYAAFTEKGMLMYDMINASDIAYDIRIFGQLIDIDGAQGETFLLGDTDGNGRVTIEDATLLQRYFAEYPVADRARIVKCGDANCDGRVDINDVTAIQRYLAGLDYGNTNIGKAV